MITKRRILLLLCTLIFLVVAPLSIVYGLGYKYNWQKKEWQKTGVFFVKSYPRSSDIFLNDKQEKKVTPTQITRLLPNSYEVKISKKNYQAWKKNLTIEPQLTTFIEDVSLFYTDPEIKLIGAGNFIDFLAHETKPLIALTENKDNQNSLYVYQLNGDLKKIYETQKDSLKLLSWSEGGQKLLALNKTSGRYVVINVSGETAITLPTIVAGWTNLQWDKNNDNFIYGLDQKNNLWRLDISKKITETAAKDEKVLAYTHRPEGLIIITADPKKPTEAILKIANNNEFTDLLNLSSNDKYSFKFPPQQTNIVALFNETQKQLYLFDLNQEKQPLLVNLTSVNNLNWLDKTRLLYWNDAELTVFDLATNSKNLIERTSQKISYGFWHQNGVYAYAVIDKLLKLYELDSRDKRNVYEFQNIHLNDNNFITTNSQGDTLYFAGRWSDQEAGLYSAVIQ